MTRHLLPGVRAELAAAIRAVNAAYLRIPEAARPEAAVFNGLEDEVDAAFAAGDRERALAAIAAWRAHHLSRFKRAAADAAKGPRSAYRPSASEQGGGSSLDQANPTRPRQRGVNRGTS